MASLCHVLKIIVRDLTIHFCNARRMLTFRQCAEVNCLSGDGSLPMKPIRVILVLVGIGAICGILFFPADPEPQEPSADVPAVHEPLPDSDREFLWEAEHRGLLLTKFGWNPALRALAKDSVPASIERILAADFTAEWQADAKPLETQTEGLTAHRGMQSDQTESPSVTDKEVLNASEFAAELVKRRQQFGDEIRTHFKLLAVYPVDRNAPDGSWNGRGRITLTGTSESGQQLVCQLGISYRTTFPDETQLPQGHWLEQCTITKERVIKSDRPLFEDVTRRAGLDANRLHDNWDGGELHVNTGGVYLCDFNRDGCTDVLVTDLLDFAGIILYEGSTEGKFRDVTVERGLPKMPDTVNAVFADLDNDGWEDLLIPDRALFRNEDGRRFTNITSDSNVVSLVGRFGEVGMISMTGVSVADYDADGLIDLYVTRGDAHGFKNGSWIDGKSGQFTPSQLLRNTGDFQFVDVTEEAAAGGGNRSVFASVWLDANDDGWPDVYVINEFGAGLLLVNEGGKKFRSVELDDHSSDFASMGLNCGDFNNDGLTDIYVSNMFSSAGNRVMDNLPPGFYDETVTHKLRRMVAGNQLHMNNGDLSFEGVGPDLDVAQVGWGWGPAVADFNNDGWLDIYATCGFMSHTRANPDG